MVDQRTGNRHDFTRKGGVDGWEQMTPAHAPDWMKDPAACWNSVEAFERRADAQTAREINMALPRELTTGQMKDLTRAWVQKNCVDRGMVATVAWHDLDSENPHAHVMLTMREIDGDGWSKKKARQWNDKALLNQWRETWANEANAALEAAGSRERIDHRSLKDQGLDRVPTRHMGPKATAMERRGETPDRQRLVMPTPASMDHAQALADRQREQAKPAPKPTPEQVEAAEWKRKNDELDRLIAAGKLAFEKRTEEAEQRRREREAAAATLAATEADKNQHEQWAAVAAGKAVEKDRAASQWHSRHRLRSWLGLVPQSVKDDAQKAELLREQAKERKKQAAKAAKLAGEQAKELKAAQKVEAEARADLAKVQAARQQLDRARAAHWAQSPAAKERAAQEMRSAVKRRQAEAERAARWEHAFPKASEAEQEAARARQRRDRGPSLSM